ncbi:hypothetical protein CEB3_c18690 [Peptococcaceae bacterium CEB3]|nr:hypothetical protein CEB3_c18690 [Peptococcaceae bacterium CEB3]
MWVGIQVNHEHTGSVTVSCPFKVSGYFLDSAGQPRINAEVKAQIASKAETGFTNEEGHFEVMFRTLEPGGPYAISVNEDTANKLSVTVEEDFSWNAPPAKDVFVEAIERKRSFFEHAHSPVPQMVAANQIIVFLGTKGGLGVSSVSAAVARELYAQGIPVMVIEAARSGGSLARMFGQSPAKQGLDTFSDISPDEIGEATMGPYLTEIRKGLEILPISAAGNLHGKTHWTLPAAKELYRWASRRSGYVVVDAGSDLTFPLANAALWMANKVFPVAGASPVAVDSAVRFAVMSREAHWTRIIPGWVMRGGDPGELELLTGIKAEFPIKDSADWEQVAHGKTTGQIKKSLTKIIKAAQVVIGGGI